MDEVIAIVWCDLTLNRSEPQNDRTQTTDYYVVKVFAWPDIQQSTRVSPRWSTCILDFQALTVDQRIFIDQECDRGWHYQCTVRSFTTCLHTDTFNKNTSSDHVPQMTCY